MNLVELKRLFSLKSFGRNSEMNEVIVVSLAATLLTGGKTVHSIFKIPIE